MNCSRRRRWSGTRIRSRRRGVRILRFHRRIVHRHKDIVDAVLTVEGGRAVAEHGSPSPQFSWRIKIVEVLIHREVRLGTSHVGNYRTG